MQVIVKTRRVGGSVMATIPKHVVNALDIKNSEFLKVDIKKAGKDFFGRLKGIGRFSIGDELTTHD